MELIVEIRAQGTQADVITYSAATIDFWRTRSGCAGQRFVEMAVEVCAQGLQTDVISCIAAISATRRSRSGGASWS